MAQLSTYPTRTLTKVAGVDGSGNVGLSAPAGLTKTDDTNVTLTLGGTPASATLQDVSLTLGWTGQLGPTRGGTGISTYALGDLLYSSSTNTLAKLSGNTTTTRKFLRQTGSGSASAAPAWDVLSPTDVPVSVYYVGSSGNDSNDGLSSGAAWASISKVNASTFRPGDSILFQGGQTFSGAIVAPSGGTPSRPITFGSYGNGKATISSSTSSGFTSTSLGGLIVRDLVFSGSSSTNHGVIIQNTLSSNAHLEFIRVLNCDVTGYGRNGIFVTGGAGSAGFDDVLISGCTATGCCGQTYSGNGTAGIIVQSVSGYGIASNPVSFNNVTIENCIAYSNAGSADTNWSGSGIFIGQTNIGVVRNCTAYSNGASSTYAAGPCGIWTSDSVNVIITDCVSRDNRSGSTGDGGGFNLDEGCVDCTIMNCYSSGNDGAGLEIYSGTTTGITGNNRCAILNCVSINDGGHSGGASNASIIIGGNNAVSTNYRIEGCTVYQSNASAKAVALIGSQVAAMTGIVANNTFVLTATSQTFVSSSANPTGLRLSGNRYSSSSGYAKFVWNGTTYNSLSEWTIGASQETQALNVYEINAGGNGLTLAGGLKLNAANLSQTSADTTSTNYNIENTSSGGHSFSLFSTGSGNGPGHFGVYDNTSRSGNGLSMIDFDGSTGNTQIIGQAGFGWSTDAHFVGATFAAIMYVDGTGQIAQRNSTAAQKFSVYNTYTDASNYERAVFDWKTVSNVLTIGMQAAGTGTVRDIHFAVGTSPQVLVLSQTGALMVGANGNSYSMPIAASEYFTGRDTSGTATGATSDLAFQYGGNGGGFRQWIATWHNNGATGNYFKFYLNTSSSAGGSSAPGTNNIVGLSIGNEGISVPSGYMQSGVTTVASLPAAAAGNKGARYFVTDANATTFWSIVAGSGSNNVPVTSDGTNWRIG